jgi:ATP-binding cassette subfamily B protein
MLALGLLWTPLSLLLPLPVKIILDSVTGSHPLPSWLAWWPGSATDPGGRALTVALVLSVGVTALVLAHNTVEWLLRESLSDWVVRDLRGRIARRALDLSALGERTEGDQDYAYRIAQDAPSLQTVAVYGLPPILTSVASLVVLLWVTSRLSPAAAGLALATSLPLVAFIQLKQGRMREGWHAVKTLDAQALAGVQESLRAWRIVVNSGQEDRVLDRFGRLARAAFRERLRVMCKEAALGSLMAFGIAVGTAAILWVSVRNVQSGRLTAGDLILITTYVAQLYAPIQTIASHVSGQQAALASVERTFAVLDAEPPVRTRPGARPIAAARGEIEFRGASFGYCPDRTIIRDASFRIPAGSWVAIAGPSGSGKTTLSNLILRFLDPSEGAILLDGADLRDYRLPDLRRQFGFLGQDAALLSGTVAENIAFARPEAPREEIVRAAKLARAHDFVAALPHGYDTMVGEGGNLLSGGERQRVALARAYLKDAPVLMLDEPTSALDKATEADLIAELRTGFGGRTVFVVTHSAAMLDAADLVLRVSGGEVRLTIGTADAEAAVLRVA